MLTTRVVGIGQPVAGDDGVGHAVIAALEATTLPPGTVIMRIREASALLTLLESGERLVIVDGLVDAGVPGTVHVLDAEALDSASMSAVSSHGISVPQALELARTLSPGSRPDVRVVGVSIAAPTEYGEGLSTAVARAVPAAVDAIVALVGDRHA